MKKLTRKISEMERKIDFVTLASHALRTPLSATKWYLEVLRKEKIGPLNARQCDFLQEAYRSNERMVKIINDLLFVSRIQEKKVEFFTQPSQLADVIRGVLKEISALQLGGNRTFYCKIYHQCPRRQDLVSVRRRQGFYFLFFFTPQHGLTQKSTRTHAENLNRLYEKHIAY